MKSESVKDPPTQYGFYLDTRFCTGCKACQVACKDRHGLATGQLWRRVYEVSGGGWQRQGRAWAADVFAYNLSLSCNHCAEPACAAACPAGAITRRADGIVVLDPQRCLGCRYCSWACPYDAPRYDVSQRVMSKCDFCVEDVQAGKPPACVAACPLRVLEYGDRRELAARAEAAAAVLPLPDPAMTQPALALIPHARALPADSRQGRVANLEEVATPAKHAMAAELPLALFTLLAQAAVGVFWALGAAGALDGPALLLPGGLALLAGALALLHLGRPERAYRALAGARTSWLSREILCLLLFAGLGAGFAGAQGLRWGPSGLRLPLGLLAALAGLALVYCMARIYQLPAMPAWDTPATLLSFLATTLILGSLAALVAWGQPDRAADGMVRLAGAGLLLLALGAWAWIGRLPAGLGTRRLVVVRRKYRAETWRLAARLALTLAGVALGMLALLTPFYTWAAWLGLILAGLGEFWGRLMFYESALSPLSINI